MIFIAKQLNIDGQSRRFIVYCPTDYNPTVRWPLIVFLHGRDERGDDGWMATTVGLGPAVRQSPERFRGVVLFPQCPVHCWWDGVFRHLDAIITATEATYAVDPQRIVLTGISMGGYGTWRYGASRAKRFAALMPICGGGDPADAPLLARFPIWAFHGADDPVVPPAASRSMVAAVRSAGGNVTYTEYLKVAHDCWTRTYQSPEVIHWLFRPSSLAMSS